MSSEPLELVLFDLDGTLYRTTELLPVAYRRGIERFQTESEEDVTVPEQEAITEQVGNPVDEIYANLFPDLSEEGAHDLSVAILDELTDMIRDEQGHLIDGVPEVLDRLHGTVPLGIVTNARRPYLEAVAETYDLDEWFDRMMCLTDVNGQRKAIMVESQLDYFDTSDDRSLLVGDRSSDEEAASETRLDFVGCNFGYGEADEFSTDQVVQEFRELLDQPRLRKLLQLTG